MDVDFHRTSLFHAARFSYTDESEEDDSRACFPCPFCYVEIELAVLCSHFQEEHCFDLKNAVCPLCAGNLGKDVIGHFVVHHTSSLKRRKKPQSSGLWAAGPRERSFSSVKRNDSAPDPLLSPFLCHTPIPNPEIVHREESLGSGFITSNSKSDDSSSVDEGHEQEDTEERKRRVAFVQQLMASMIF